MQTLEEAIKHCEEVVENHEKSCDYYKKHNLEEYVPSERKYIEEHRQLAEWLKELKAYKDARVGCEYCKHNYREQHERPCSLCQRNFMDMFEMEVNADADSD